MNTKTLFLLVIGTALALPAWAAEVDKTVPASADGSVEVSNVAGSVSVTGWSRNEVSVTGTIGRNVEEVIVEADGDEVTVKVKTPRRGGRGIDADLEIRVPAGSSLDIGTVSAGIDVEGVDGEQDLQSVSGNIEVEFRGGEIEAEAVSGNVDIRGEGIDGEVDAASVSGTVSVHGVSGEVEAESVSGNVVVEGGAFDDIELETVTGSIRYHGELRDDGSLSAETVNGTTDIQLSGEVSANIEVETLNGRIRNCFGPEPQKASKYGPGWELEFTAGDGDSDISIATINGRVTLCNK